MDLEHDKTGVNNITQDNPDSSHSTNTHLQKKSYVCRFAPNFSSLYPVSDKSHSRERKFNFLDSSAIPLDGFFNSFFLFFLYRRVFVGVN